MISRSMLESSLMEDLPALSSQRCSDSTIISVRSAALWDSVFKKFTDDLNGDADRAAIQLFKQVNEKVGTYKYQPSCLYNEWILNDVKSSLWSMFDPMSMECYDYSWSSIWLRAETGPGASIQCPSYNFYTKMFDSGMSCTNPRLLEIYQAQCDRYSKTWYEAEMLRYYRHGCDIVEGNKLSTVPKNVNISRTICTEPTLNMYFQKGLGRILEDILAAEFNIRLDKQPDINRNLARIGSIDGSYATIDLSSASDTISLELLRNILPSRFFDLLNILRSPTGRVGNEVIELNMVSTMGNGFTFPLQTLLFACIVRSVYRTMGFAHRYDGTDFSVFGDDIICRTFAYERVVSVLEDCGFVVNRDKSFAYGQFRESCGEDYFRGYNVRGVYIRSLKTQSDINAAFNKLAIWQCQTGILLRKTNKLFLNEKHIKVPLWCDPSSGYYATSTYLGSARRTFKILKARPSSFELQNLPYDVRMNPGGILQSVVGGYVRNGRITLRSNVPRFSLSKTASWFPDDVYMTKQLHKGFDPSWFPMMDLIYD